VFLPIHIAAGGLAIVLGAVALSVKKGGTIHRRAGQLFVYAMLVMGCTAPIVASLADDATDASVVGNALAGLMVAYFVGTALMTVRPVSPWTRRINVAALILALGIASVDILGGIEAFHSPGRQLRGVPFFMHFFLATILLLAAIGDVRVLRYRVPRGGARLARHLWRMCFALFIAAGSFFSVRERVAKILPDPLTTGPIRALPILLVFAAMFYWLWRVRSRRRLPVLVRNDAGANVVREERVG
jgi:uncharacterized membrane protein